MTTRTNTLIRRAFRLSLATAGVTAILGAATLAPALADPGGWHGRGVAREHESRDHDRFDRERFERRPYAYVAPSYGYGYAPPVYAAPSLSFVFPIR